MIKSLYGKRTIDEYMAALRLKHDSPEVHNNLGNAFDEKGLTDRAIEHYNYAIKLRPDYGAAHYNIAIAYESKGLMDKAAEHYRMAEKLKFRNSAD